MKHLKKISSIVYPIFGLSLAQLGFAQGNPSPEATDRGIVPDLGVQNDSGGKPAEGVNASDAGAQRPVKLKKKGVSTFFGYSSKYFYRSNPLMASGKLSQQKTAMWTNAFFAGAGLGVIETDSSVITPYIGGSWTINDYIEGGLDTLNYNSSGAYALLLAQYGNGWSARAGVNYASDSSTENDTEDYSEFFPNIGVMKAFALTDSTLGIFDASAGKHVTSSFDLFKGKDAGVLDNWEMASSYSLKWNATGKLAFTPQYRLSYKVYEDGSNKDRDDLTNALSLRIAYNLSSSVTLDLSTSYSKRTTSGVPINMDFKNLDTGAGLALNARF